MKSKHIARPALPPAPKAAKSSPFAAIATGTNSLGADITFARFDLSSGPPLTVGTT